MNSAFAIIMRQEPAVAFCLAFPKKTTPMMIIMINAHLTKGLLSKNPANHFSSTIIFSGSIS